MKKFFYYVARFQPGDNFRVTGTVSGVCESKEDGLFPVVEVISEVSLSLKSHPIVSGNVDVTKIHIINTEEISENDFLMMSYNEINGNDSEK